MRYCSFTQKDIEVQLFEQSNQLPESWDALLPAAHFLQSKQLAVYEQAKLPDVDFLYALISVEGKLVAAAYFQVLHIKEKHLDVAQLQPLQKQAWRAFTALSCPKLLVAGHLFRHDICSYYWDRSSSAYEAYRCYETAIKAALKRSHAHAALVKDVADELIPYFQHYAPKYLLLRNDISMEMGVSAEWENMKDYEKSLKHKYAQRFRKVRQGWEQLEIKELSVEETEANKKILFDLYQQVSLKQPVRLGLLSEDFIPALKKQHPADLHVWLAYQNGQPVAFFSAWTHPEAFDMFYIGFDYAHNESLQLYFNILFFSIEQAIAFKKEKLILGRTALEAKARLGCKPEYLSTFLYIRNRLVRNIMLRLQQNITNQEGEWENRHPFKK